MHVCDGGGHRSNPTELSFSKTAMYSRKSNRLEKETFGVRSGFAGEDRPWAAEKEFSVI